MRYHGRWISVPIISASFSRRREGTLSSTLQSVASNARELLKDSGLSIKEICAESGYSDPNYFSRIFKKYEV